MGNKKNMSMTLEEYGHYCDECHQMTGICDCIECDECGHYKREPMTVKQKKQFLMDLDHDCHNSPEDACTWCAWVYHEATRNQINYQYGKYKDKTEADV